jgi:hypothetical protein
MLGLIAYNYRMLMGKIWLINSSGWFYYQKLSNLYTHIIFLHLVLILINTPTSFCHASRVLSDVAANLVPYFPRVTPAIIEKKDIRQTDRGVNTKSSRAQKGKKIISDYHKNY